MLPQRILLLAMLTLAIGAGVPLPVPAGAQEPAPSLRINQVDGSAYPALRIVVSALDANGAPVPGLAPGAFQAFEGETPIPTTGLQTPDDPAARLSVVLVIDVSARMQRAPLDAAKQAATAFVQSLRPADDVAILTFNDTVAGVSPFTTDRALLSGAIGGLNAGGGAALFEAMQASAFAAGTSQAPRRAVVLLTAGADDASDDATAESALATAEGAGVPVFTVALDPATDDAFLRSLTAATMGEHRAAPPEGAAAATDALATVLRGQYVLTATGGGVADGSTGELRVIADLPGSPAGAISSFRRGLAVAGAAPADDGGSGARTLLIVALAVAAAVALVAAGFGASTLLQRWRLGRKQRNLVEPNHRRAAEQGLPRQVGAYRSGESSVAGRPSSVAEDGHAAEDEALTREAGSANGQAHAAGGPALDERRSGAGDRRAMPAPANVAAPVRGAGRLVEKTSRGRGAAIELGVETTVIGSSARECTLVLPEGLDVAPVHARIWYRGGKYQLTHAGGFRRRTLVGGAPTERCVLEHGDELQIGAHRWLYEEDGHEVALRF